MITSTDLWLSTRYMHKNPPVLEMIAFISNCYFFCAARMINETYSMKFEKLQATDQSSISRRFNGRVLDLKTG